MPFQIGDVVRYKPELHGALDRAFVADYGYGPYAITGFYMADATHGVAYCNTMQGTPMINNQYRGELWRHGLINLERDEFLTAVRRATHEI